MGLVSDTYTEKMGRYGDERDDLLTISEAREFARREFGRRLPASAIRAMIAAGRLPATKGADRVWRFTRCDFCGAFLELAGLLWHRLDPPTTLPRYRRGDRLHTPETCAELMADLIGDRAPSADDYRAWIAAGELETVVDEHGRRLFHHCDACRLQLRRLRET